MKGTVQTSSSASHSNSGWDLHYPHLLKRHHYRFKTPEHASFVATQITLACELENPYLELGLNELFLNAIEHGNLEVTKAEKALFKNTTDWLNLVNKKLKHPSNLEKKVNVTLEITPFYTFFEIADQGKGFDWKNLHFKQPSPHKRHGRGLLLASELCFDKLEFIGKGNVIHCVCWKE